MAVSAQANFVDYLIPGGALTTLNFLLAFFQTVQQLVPAFWQSGYMVRLSVKIMFGVGCANCRFLNCQAAAVLILKAGVWFALFHNVCIFVGCKDKEKE